MILKTNVIWWFTNNYSKIILSLFLMTVNLVSNKKRYMISIYGYSKNMEYMKKNARTTILLCAMVIFSGIL